MIGVQVAVEGSRIIIILSAGPRTISATAWLSIVESEILIDQLTDAVARAQEYYKRRC